MTAARLPPGLTPWAEPLSALDPHLAIALGPMIRHLDQLLARRTPVDGTDGDLDGYGGLSRRGDPSRLVMSEWSLAEEVPFEFLRRAASAELLHLAPNVVEDRSRGRVAVLADCGPDQLGAGRLVQLAVLIVASRRATRRGAQLALGILGDEPGAWRTGETKELLRGWLSSRNSHPPPAGDVAAWTAGLDAGNECWVLTGPRLAGQLPGHPKVIASTECAWGPHGAIAVDVRLDGDRLELALPHGDVAVRALRGSAWRSDGPALVEASGLRAPCFPGAAPRLLGRGRDATELVSVPVPAGRPKRYRYPGPVVAAAHLGRRLVALVLDDDELRVTVSGKGLGRVDRIAVPLYAVELDPSVVARGTDAAPWPMVYESGDLLVRLGDTWWRLPPDGEPVVAEVSAVLPTQRTDVPRMAWSGGGGMAWAPPARIPAGVREVVLGPGDLVAWRASDELWRLAPDERSIIVPADESVLGLTSVTGSPALLTRTAGGLILRLRWPAGHRTLTRWSGEAESPALHPTRPWIAVPREDGRVDVVDLESDTLLLVVPSTL